MCTSFSKILKTYKSAPGEPALCEIKATYERDDALDVIRRSMADYNTFSTVHRMVGSTDSDVL